jgi:hypothetical protein
VVVAWPTVVERWDGDSFVEVYRDLSSGLFATELFDAAGFNGEFLFDFTGLGDVPTDVLESLVDNFWVNASGILRLAIADVWDVNDSRTNMPFVIDGMAVYGPKCVNDTGIFLREGTNERDINDWDNGGGRSAPGILRLSLLTAWEYVRDNSGVENADR